MKRILIISIVMATFSACNRFDPVDHVFENSVYLDVSALDKVQTATFSDKVQTATRQLFVTLAYPSDRDVSATVTLAPDLVSEYNATYGTDYGLLPDKFIDFSSQTVTVPAGKINSEPVTIGFRSLMGEEQEGGTPTGGMEIDKTWLLPVRLTSNDMAIMESSAVAYYLVKRSSSITTAARLLDNWINFPLMDEPGPVADAYNGLTAITYEALVNIDRFLTKINANDVHINSVMGVEQYLLLRIGDTNFERQQLQFDGSGSGSKFGKIPVKTDATKNLSAGEWYHVACTFDQNTHIARIYLNGRIIDEASEIGPPSYGEGEVINLAMRALETVPADQKQSYQFFIGRSYNDDRPLYGMIAEARVWKVERTPEQIWANMYRIAAPELEPDLIGYWKFDEGQGNVIKDYSSVGNHGQAQTDIIWPSGVEIPELNKQEQL